jgi:hypothetical protein
VARRKGKKSELYIWSLVLLGIALAVISLNFLPDSSFGFVSTLIGLGGMGLSMSGRWKNAGDVFHWSVLVISTLVIFGILVVHLLYTSFRKQSVTHA